MFQAESVDRLSAAELRGQLPGAIIGQQIVVLEQTISTNDAILQVATTNAKEGLVLFAEHQTAGRGQRGNRWESAPGKGLWFSILLRPKIRVNDSAQLTIWAIETISDIIGTEFSLEPTIKLPNDIQIHGRKVAGVLTEMRAQEKASHLAIVGIGINVNHSLQDFPSELQDRAISLAMARQRPVDRQKFAVAVLQNLDRTYRARFAPKC
jgi:BirA family transcriptional regulator, biotin operon repressor / biotin---[acetyl-CoA-carboxylase] ligase